MNRLLSKTGCFFKKNIATILTGIGTAGVVITAVSAIKATPKALYSIEEAEKEKGDKLSNKEKIITTTHIYLPTIIIGVSTIACILGANVLNKKQQASLISAYALLQKSYNEYRDKVDELYENSSIVDKEIAKDVYDNTKPSVSSDEKCLFYDMFSKRYFESNKVDVIAAEYHFNRNFTLRGYATLNELYEFLGVDKIDGGDSIGWSIDAGLSFYGYSWIDFEHDFVTTDDGMEVCLISMPFAPTSDYLDGWLWTRVNNNLYYEGRWVLYDKH